jgi:hypothetical protein
MPLHGSYYAGDCAAALMKLAGYYESALAVKTS